MPFEFEQLPNAVGKTESLDSADLFSNLNGWTFPNGQRSESPAQMLRVYLSAEVHKRQEAEERARGEYARVKMLETPAGPAGNFSGSERDLAEARKKIDQINENVSRAGKLFDGEYLPNGRWGIGASKDPNFKIDQATTEAEKLLIESMKLDINSTSLAVDRLPFDPADAHVKSIYPALEQAVGLAERDKIIRLLNNKCD